MDKGKINAYLNSVLLNNIKFFSKILHPFKITLQNNDFVSIGLPFINYIFKAPFILLKSLVSIFHS